MDPPTELKNVTDGFNGWDDPGLRVIFHICAAFILTIFTLIAICGNVLVCVAIVTDYHLRQIGNVFTFSLACADLLVGLIVMPLALINDLLGQWNLPWFMCGVWISFDIMGTTASILNLCAISLDRYIHIKDPLHYNATVTTRTIVPAVVMLWILSTLISFVPINLGWHQAMQSLAPSSEIASQMSTTGVGAEPFDLLMGLTLATNDSMDPVSAGQIPESAAMWNPKGELHCALEINPIYAVTSSVISFYFPCMIMLVIYLRLYFEAQRHVKAVKQITCNVYYNSCSNGHSANGRISNGNYFSESHVHSRMISEHKAAITLGIIVSVFLICWAPFFAINIIHANCRCISNITFKALTWLGYCNSAFNPIIYSIFNQDFRKAFRKLLRFDQGCSGSDAYSDRNRAYSGISVPQTPQSRRQFL